MGVHAALLSPPWDPAHCPPGVVWLPTMNGDGVERVRLFRPLATDRDSP